MEEIIITEKRQEILKKDLELIWEVMLRIIKEEGKSDLTLNLEGAYYNFRDMVSAIGILKSVISEASELLHEGSIEDALKVIFEGLEVEHEYFDFK